jgi:hypothetical protein
MKPDFLFDTDPIRTLSCSMPSVRQIHPERHIDFVGMVGTVFEDLGSNNLRVLRD